MNYLYEWFKRFSRCRIRTPWTFTRYQSTCVFPTSSSSWWNAKPFDWNAEPQRRGRQAFGTHMVYRETFLQVQLCLLQHLIRRNWIHGVQEYQTRFTSTAEKNENQTPVQDQRCQSGPSAKNSVLPCEGDPSKNYGADQQRPQISDLHFDKFPTPATFACWKTRLKTGVCTCSQFPTEALHWIKEVEMVDSVDDFKSSSSIRGISMPNFEVLHARIASAMNRIIHNSRFKRRVSLLRGKQIPYLIYEYIRVTGTNDSARIMLTYSLLVFEMMYTLFCSLILDHGVLLIISISGAKIPIWYLLLNTSFQFAICDNQVLFSSDESPGHTIPILSWVSQTLVFCIWTILPRCHQVGFSSCTVEFHPTLNRIPEYQRILGDCWQWESNGQCSRGDNCSVRHDIYKRGKMTQSNPSPNSVMRQNERNASRTQSPRENSPSGRMFRWPCKDYLQGTLQNACSTRPRVVANLGKSARMHIVRLMNNLVKCPKRMITKVQ